MDALGAAAFKRRLRPDQSAPIAVAFSGGGDSLAALLATKAWADRHARRLLVLTVDHRLRPEGADWTVFAGEIAKRLGADFRPLSWDEAKPSTGIPAAARAARHRLLADAAREAGAQVVVLGHTADDILEAQVMRGWGANLGALREWSPSPAWPEGRGLFLLRPMLGDRRAALRTWLTGQGERWVDDPTNVDPLQMRARARLEIAGGGEVASCADDGGELPSLAAQAETRFGAIAIARACLREVSPTAARRWLAAAALSAGGGARPPRGRRLAVLAERVLGSEPVRATLCGARIVADDREVLVARDAGERARGGLSACETKPGQAVVWDGRFEIVADRPGQTVRPLAGFAARLAPAERAALSGAPGMARGALPVLVDENGVPTCPILAGRNACARDLTFVRMQAACGAISKEPAA